MQKEEKYKPRKNIYVPEPETWEKANKIAYKGRITVSQLFCKAIKEMKK